MKIFSRKIKKKDLSKCTCDTRVIIVKRGDNKHADQDDAPAVCQFCLEHLDESEKGE